MDATGAVVALEAVAREAGVCRSWLYNQPNLGAEIEHLRACPFPTGSRPPDASLRRLEAATKRNRQLEAANHALCESLTSPLRSGNNAPLTCQATSATRRRRNLPPSSGVADGSVEDSGHHALAEVRKLQVVKRRGDANDFTVLLLKGLASANDGVVASLRPEHREALKELVEGTDFSMFETLDVEEMLELHRTIPTADAELLGPPVPSA
jgi:hypothetical protein